MTSLLASEGLPVAINVRVAVLAGTSSPAKLGTLTKRQDSVGIANGSGDALQKECNAGERRISGGTSTSGVGTAAGWSTIRSGPSANGWDAAARNETGSAATLIVKVLCLEG